MFHLPNHDMAELHFGQRQLGAARLVCGALAAAGAVYVALVETWLPAEPLEAEYTMLRRAMTLAAVLYLAAMAATHLAKRQRQAVFHATTRGVSSAVTFFLLLAAVWSWFRGAQSRLLLAGASDLLAVITVAVLLHAAWQLVDWQWRVRALPEPAAGPSAPLARRASSWAEAFAGAALLGCWIALEMLALPHAR